LDEIVKHEKQNPKANFTDVQELQEPVKANEENSSLTKEVGSQVCGEGAIWLGVRHCDQQCSYLFRENA